MLAGARGTRGDGAGLALESANGIALSPDGGRLYVAETRTGRIWSWDIDRSGALRHGHTAGHHAGGTLVCTTPGYAGFDSIAVDAVGHICAATITRGVISVIHPHGHLEATVHLPDHDPAVTNLCFCGPGLRKAYVTTADLGKLYEVDWPWPGLALNVADAVSV